VNNRRLTSRDYKSRQPGSFDVTRWKQFAIGLGSGLVVALVVYVSDHRAPAQQPEESKPTPHAAATGQAPDPVADAPQEKYAFYDMLPKFEVVVPEKEHGGRVEPTAKIDQPGIYFLQAGSFRDEAVAQRIHDQLARQGIDAAVQRVAVDADVWHRVRIGPIKDLDQLNKLRQQLRAADLDALVIKVAQ